MYRKARRRSHLQKEFGFYLKERREVAGLSQSEVARALGYSSPQFVSNFERGLCSPPLPALKKICELYKLVKKDLLERILRQEREYLEDYLGIGSGVRIVSSLPRSQIPLSRKKSRKRSA